MRKNILWGFYTVLLVILYLLSSTDLILKESEPRVYPVSIVLNDTTDEFYASFKKGIDRACEEFNVDVNLVTLYREGDISLQRSNVEDEFKLGAGAVIVSPVSDCDFNESNLVIIGSENKNNDVSNVTINYTLAEEGLKEKISTYPAENTIYIFSHANRYEDLRQRLDLELGKKFSVERVDDSYDSDIFRKKIEEIVINGKQGNIIICSDVVSMTRVAQIIDGSDVYGQYVGGLFGVGSSTYLLNKLYEKKIDGLVVWDSYDEGYMAMKFAVEMIKKNIQNVELDSFFITGEDLEKDRFMKMLYPIE